MSFVNELFERLSKSNTANDVQTALASLNEIQDLIERTKAARETVQLIQSYGQELVGKGQFKNAANQFYSGSQVVKNFLNDPNLENQCLILSAQALANASQEHITWDDLIGGAACMTISSLLRIITGDWNVNSHLDDFIKANDFSNNQAATACLYIPYNLVTAVNRSNPNPELLQQASDFTEQYLMTAKPASMFVDGIKRALDLTRQVLMDTTKFPSIKAKFNYKTDVIFGEKFTFSVQLENIGEGIANNVIATIKIPSNLTIVSGQNQISSDQLQPGTLSEGQFTLICPSGEGNEEISIEIPVFAEFTDILGNKNSLSLGMAIFPIRSEKKGDKLTSQLTILKKNLREAVTPFESTENFEVRPIVQGMISIIDNLATSTESRISKGDFKTAEAELEQLNQIQTFFGPLTRFLSSYQDRGLEIVKSLKEIHEQSQELVKSIEQIENRLQSS
ncbi:hypothetical protein CEE45_05060 [Candidatus Heimdallarchaeota archaeon B3_Heim]|nr:MAG: hypothetical protein CEE45_05060 [Candidatus Heimdallarchaeota archaeon B3_Heim]